jgi:hypothetical protein
MRARFKVVNTASKDLLFFDFAIITVVFSKGPET